MGSTNTPLSDIVDYPASLVIIPQEFVFNCGGYAIKLLKASCKQMPL